MQVMKRFPHATILLLCLIVISGCATRLGTSTADGTYLNTHGEVVNVYASRYDVTVQAGIEVLAAMKIPVRYVGEGYNETIVFAEALDGSPLKLRFIQEGRDLTAVKVRTGVIGFWDDGFSYQIHALIKEQLKGRTRISPGTPPDLKATVAPAGVSSDTIETKRTVSAPAPAPASKSPKRPVPKETERLASVPTVPAPEKKASPVPDGKPSRSPLTESDITVYFDEDSNLPNPDELAKLEQAAHQAFENPLWHMTLTGYAGSQEIEGHPQMVSESRVSAVKFYLIGKGVDANRIVTIANDLSVSEKVGSAQRLRRVEIRFILGP